MVTGSVIRGSSEVGKMVLTPSPGMANLIVSAPSTRLVTAIASRKVHSVLLQPPAPVSEVVLTVKMRAWAGLAVSIGPTAMSATSKLRTIIHLPAGLSVFARIIFRTPILGLTFLSAWSIVADAEERIGRRTTL